MNLPRRPRFLPVLCFVALTALLAGCFSDNVPNAAKSTVAKFDRLDTDGSGSLSRPEFYRSKAADRASDKDQLFADLDRDRSGALSIGELRSAAGIGHD